MATRYIAGWNMPGYLPEMEPVGFETFQEAKDFILDELNNQADSVSEDYHECQAYVEANVDAAKEDGPFDTGEMPDGYVYWVEYSEDSE